MGEVLVFCLTWIIGLAMMLFLLYFVSKHNLWFRKYGLTLFIVFLVIGFSVYFWGYFWGFAVDDSSLLHAIGSLFLALFSSGRIMVMELDIGSTKASENIELYRAIYGVVMFSAMILLAVMVVANIGGGIMGRLRLLFLQTIGSRHNVYLIYGVSQESVFLVKDIHKKDPNGTILVLCGRDEYADDTEDRKHLENDIYRYGAFKLSFALERRNLFLLKIASRCRKHSYIICMHSKRWKNIKLLNEICQAEGKKIPDRLHLYVLSERERIRRIAENNIYQKWDIHWEDPEELAARQLILSKEYLTVFPKSDNILGRVERDFNLAVIGWSGTAEELCRYLIPGVQTAGMHIRIQLFGAEAAEKTAYFQVSNPALGQAVQLDLCREEPDTKEFYEYFIHTSHCPDGIFFTGTDAAKNMELALRLDDILQRYQKKVPLFVKEKNISEDSGILKTEGLAGFGCQEQIYSYDILINEKLDGMAKAVHCFYKQYYGEQGDENTFWKTASIYEKFSSRAMAVHIPWKVCAAGYVIVSGLPDGSYEQDLEKNPVLVENLSIGEHLRWEASLFCEGWKSGTPEQMPPGSNKDPKKLLHTCLVPWEKLPEVGRYYDTDYQYLDTHLVKSIGHILKTAGYAMKKEE